MRFSDLPRALAGDPQPLWVITGEEPLLMIEAADLIRERARQVGYSEREVLNAQANWNWQQVFDSCQAMSLFGDRKIVELRLASSKPGTQGAQALSELGTIPLDGVLVVVTIPWDWSLKKAKWFTLLTQNAQLVQCDAVSARDLPAWFAQRLARNDQRAEPEALQLLAERCEGNLLAASQEVLKLAYRHPKGATITASDVAETVSDVSRFDVDNLLEAMFSGDAPRSVRIVENLRAKAEPVPALMWMITDELQGAAKARCAIDNGLPQASALQQSGLFGPRRTRVAKALGRLSSKRLASALMLCADIDRLSKGLTVPDRDSDVWLEIATLVSFVAR